MMIKKITASSAFILFSCLLFSQDTIYKTDGSKIIGKIIEVNAASIKYKFIDGNETVIETSKNAITRISYHNGSKEFFDNTTPKKETYTNEDKPTTKSDAPYLKNIFAVNMFEMAFTNFSFSYERIFGSGKIGLKVPVSFGMGGKQNDNNYNPDNWETTIYLTNKKFGTGLEFNFYPGGQGRNTFYVGVSGMVGSYNYYQDIHDTVFNNNGYSGYNTYPLKEKVKHIGIQYAGMLHIGWYFGLSKNILLGGKFAVGYKRDETIFVDYTRPKLQLDVNLAYRF